MEPEREWKSRATLVDLLDRVFDKGVVINADLIISVAGVPLIGVNLRAALAGMETMLKYGMMQDIDAKTRMWEAQYRKNKEVPLVEGEEIVQEMETCPQCQRGAPVKELLEKGCPRCGWVSPRLKEQLARVVVSSAKNNRSVLDELGN